MIKHCVLYIFGFVLLLPALAVSQQKNALNVEVLSSDMHERSSFDGRSFRVEFNRSISNYVSLQMGFSLSQSMNEVMPRDPIVVASPRKLREGYNGSSRDLFIGIRSKYLSISKWNFPVAFGLSRRLRVESFPDPEAELEVTLFSRDENGDRIYAVITENIYDRSVDFGIYASVGTSYQLADHWSVGLQGLYQTYTSGFSVFSLGANGAYHF